jgi:hypothetical protein
MAERLCVRSDRPVTAGPAGRRVSKVETDGRTMRLDRVDQLSKARGSAVVVRSGEGIDGEGSEAWAHSDC